jgi:hypothetical protein
MHTYVFVLDENDLKFLRKQIKTKSFDTKSSVVVLWSNSMEPFFKGSDIKYLLLSDYTKQIDFDVHKKKSLELIKTFPHKKILGDKTFVELLKYDDNSLWWLLRHGFLGNVRSIIRRIYTIRHLVKRNKIRKILILSNDFEFISVVKESVKGFNIKVELSGSNPGLKRSLEKYKDLSYASFPRVIRTLQGFFRSLKIKKKNKKKNILLFTQDWTNVNKDIKGDPNSYIILRKLLHDKNYNVLPLDVVRDIHVQWKAIREKKYPFIPYDYFILMSYFDLKIRKKIRFLRNELKSLWQRLENNESFKKNLFYEGIDLFSVLKPRIKAHFFNEYNSFIGAARNIEVSKKLIKKFGIDAVICIDENGHSRFLVFASALSDIKSIGIQHGIIFPLHPSYNYSKEDLFKYGGKMNCILADKTAVFGNRFKNLLMKYGNYNSDQIAVTGQPRTDLYVEDRNSYSKKNLCKSLGIDFNKKIVVFAPRLWKESSESKIALKEVVNSLKGMKNVALVIKVHHVDDNSFYETFLSDLEYDAIVTKETDLYTLLFCSDLVISISSTVMLDALIMDKPVVQINLLENYGYFSDLENKVFTKVTKKENLSDVIKNSLFDKSLSKKMEKERKKFILDYYNGVDGKATQRFIEVLDGLVKK